MTAPEPIFLAPVFKDRIWGGTRLRDEFGYRLPTETTGEAWTVSAHPNGPSVALNDPYAGKTLPELWTERRDLFVGCDAPEFPILVKLLDARTDLSVQVHPAKTECWYFLAADPGAALVFGHSARDKVEFESLARAGSWTSLLRRVPVHADDFFMIPSGTVHALPGGCLVIEIQETSDVTYRLYDYDRRDASGLLRDLHLGDGIAVTAAPHADATEPRRTRREAGGTVTTLAERGLFVVERYDVETSVDVGPKPSFAIASVVAGGARLVRGASSWPLPKGANVILPAGFGACAFEGRARIMTAEPGSRKA